MPKHDAPAKHAAGLPHHASRNPPPKLGNGLLVLAAAGDVNLGRACGQRLLADPSYNPLQGVASIWADADLRFVNLESPLSDQHGETQSPHHGLVFTGPPSGADALARAGIGVVSTANNHAWDYAGRGLLETLLNLDRAGVAHAGTGVDETEAYRPAILHVNGVSVAVFAVTQVWNLGAFSEEEARHHVAWADFLRLRAALLRARAEVDFVVVSYHGGEEYTDVPLPKTRAFVDAVMSLGVDVVIGHHPHVPQGVGWQRGRPVLYSLGNLVFDGLPALPWTRSSFIAKLRFQRGHPVQVAACPVLIDGYEPRELTRADGSPRRAFERHLREISDSVGGTTIAEPDGFGCYPLSPPSDITPPHDRPRADRVSALIAPN
jgi:poly-gamma-glutamate synthesis protein (capsule biosynthesis protein)